ncbi:MAG: hypothetical protein COY04_00845 [Parcubacteria group bacterium CG_4_10_14_0_2_um_filter_7_35_8]|nr:MAG: hypothetical protein COX42_01005 [Parcubacteria group bacterium CG23_combo_of_CG06-09_8_20_14_all_35_6]PIZ76975.1 MAG: hypothetical protein COY04_00845 [Parcubacteria group bacterium CG_4_10_14_0_2_um_filter_7_35_8]
MPKAQEFEQLLKTLGFELQVLELSKTTRTAVDAALAVNCQLGQIAKSIVFKTTTTQKPILVIASGSNRINEEKIAQIIGESVEKANANFVLEKTGFAIGGVAPVGHPEKIETLIDEDLFCYQEIWAAAGNPNSVFKLSPQQLLKITGGRIIKVK